MRARVACLLRALLVGVCCAGAVNRASAQVRPMTSAQVQGAAAEARDLRVIVSLAARRLWVVSAAGDTMITAPVAVGSGKVLRAAGHTWVFRTPVGVRSVVSKDTAPLWIRPDWSYVETARENELAIDSVSARRPRPLSNGRTLVVRNNTVGVLDAEGRFEEFPIDDEIVFDGVLYIPPIGTPHRAVEGTLGKYRLNLGDGIGLHGTDAPASIGRALTHGCLRLDADPLAWVFQNVPVGTRVYIY